MGAEHKTTRIASVGSDHIGVRGRNLVTELMGKLTFSEMIFLQLTGHAPLAQQTRILDAVLVTIMEHGLTPSAIVTRLTQFGAPESVQGAIAAGLLGVGDRFAGTASACAKLLDRLVSAPADQRGELALQLVREHRERQQPVPGFGHPTHTAGDPRVPRLLEIARTAGTGGQHLEALAILERALASALKKSLITNVSAAIAGALGEAGIPSAAVRGIVLTARCAGLAGHLYEEMQRPIAPAMWAAIEAEITYEGGD